MIYKVTNIDYDTDSVEVDLLKTIEINVPDNIEDDYEINEFISDEISNITGWCHKGFCTEPKLNY